MTKTPSLLELDTSRHDIRYALFRMREGTEKVAPSVDAKLVRAIKAHYESQPAFKGWKEFAVSWDVGIDDAFTASNRPSHWWCFGISRFVAVEAPRAAFSQDQWISKIINQGFAARDDLNRLMIDFEKLMEDSASRFSWFAEEN